MSFDTAAQAETSAAAKLHADDTPILVLAARWGKSATARLWVYVSDDRPAAQEVPPAVWFAYSPNREKDCVRPKIDHDRKKTKDYDFFCNTLILPSASRKMQATCSNEQSASCNAC